MSTAARRATRLLLPRCAVPPTRRWHARWATRAARRAFEAAPRQPEWLEAAELDRLQRDYPHRTSYRYDPSSLERRGDERAQEALGRLPSSTTVRSALELGCGDGMVSRRLAAAGIDAVAVDRSPELFDERARRDGVDLVAADATRLPFADERFDLVLSYNAFEHFPDPEAVLLEAARVVRPGGFVYLHFGPLYMSPLGLHAYRAITVPYCQLLFSREALESYAEREQLGPVPFDEVNGWTLERFRALWARHSEALLPRVYEEIPHIYGVELIERHPSCFRSKTSEFANLTTGTIEALFERIR